MRIIEDKRNIRCIKLFDGHISYGGVYQRIEPYEENGEEAPITWFKVFSKDNDLREEVLLVRINGKFVSEILY